MNDWTHLDGDRGRYVRRGGSKKRSAESTPGYTPTTSTSHLPRPRPKLYEAAVNGHENQLVAIKTVEESGQDCLLREFQALSALSDVNYVPKVREFNYDRSLAFIALDYLGDEWVSLDKDIQKHKPFRERFVGEDGFHKLYKSLEKALSKIHHKGVVHGDLKSNHVFIRRKNEIALLENHDSDEYELDYNDIKIIDFGASYMIGETSKWHGGSIGFSNPYHWNPNHRDGLQFSELRAIDWYSMNAILFHAYTGECFPIASPAYRLFIGKNTQPDVDAYFKQLEKGILLKFGGADALVKIVHNLCDPKDLVNQEKLSGINFHITSSKFDFRLSAPIFAISVLVLGQMLRSGNTIWEAGLAFIIFTFAAILTGSISAARESKNNRRKSNDKFTWAANLIVFAGVVVVSGINIIYAPIIFPVIVSSALISIIAIVLSSPISPKSLSPITEALLILGVLGIISIPKYALEILPILAGIGFAHIITERMKERLFCYSYSIVLLISSWIISIPQNNLFWMETPSLGHLGPIPFLLLRMIIWCCLSELSSSITYEYKTTKHKNKLYAYWSLVFSLIILNHLLPV